MVAPGMTLLRGRRGYDTYVYTRGGGEDVVDESGPNEGTADKLLLVGVASTAYGIERNGSDVITGDR